VLTSEMIYLEVHRRRKWDANGIVDGLFVMHGRYAWSKLGVARRNRKVPIKAGAGVCFP
jgi:hypothetical protein